VLQVSTTRPWEWNSRIIACSIRNYDQGRVRSICCLFVSFLLKNNWPKRAVWCVANVRTRDVIIRARVHGCVLSFFPVSFEILPDCAGDYCWCTVLFNTIHHDTIRIRISFFFFLPNEKRLKHTRFIDVQSVERQYSSSPVRAVRIIYIYTYNYKFTKID